MSNIKLYNKDCLNLMPTLESESIDIICVDPPYLYLKGQKLERPFDEQLFFSECKRLLTKNGFIVMFGRGESFYRWNTILAGIGFKFKEEIIWDKGFTSSPLLRVSRVHETVSIWCIGNRSLNKIKVPYIEIKKYDIPSIITDIKRLKSVLSNTKSFESVLEFLHNNSRSDFFGTNTSKSGLRGDTKDCNRSVTVVNGIVNGLNEKTIIRTDFENTSTLHKHNVTGNRKSAGDGNRCVKVMQSIDFGLNEKTIIKENGNRLTSIHPTQKPVRLIERLLALVLPKDKPKDQIIVADFFGGSFSTMEAVHNMGLNGISCEIDEEYFNVGKERIESLPARQSSIFDVIND